MTPDKRTILVVDDSMTVRRLLKGELSKRGYEVLSAENGAQGLESAIELQPDIIISDINMPQMDGWEFCWRVRKHQDTRYIPFLFLSDRDEVSDRVRGLEIGAEDYITKPFNIQDLVDRMETVLERRVTSETLPDLESSLMGQLIQFNLPDLLQNINMLSKSGALEIRRDRIARIFVQKGEVINASLGEAITGRKAFYRVLGWKDGYFEFKEFVPKVEKVFAENTIKLILSGLKQADEIAKFQSRMPDGNDRLIINFDDNFFNFPFNDEAKRFLDLVQEHQQFQKILDASPMEDLTVLKAVDLLLSHNILRIKKA
jgi:DNA-binding response OmpR family regulator